LRPYKRLEIIEERLHGSKDLQGMVGKIQAENLLIAERKGITVSNMLSREYFQTFYKIFVGMP
jgi:hypothetical protein